MTDPTHLGLLARFVGVLGTNLVLSGDNAVVIAMASRGLPESTRGKAIIWGATGAVGLRIVFAAVVTLLLAIPFLRLVGGVLLLWISWQLINGDESGPEVKATSGVWSAVKVIIVADAVMSLDNVIALVGVSGGNLWLLIFGLVLTIPLVIWGSTLLSNLLNRFPILVYAGAALLCWVALEMILEDDVVQGLVAQTLQGAETFIKLAGTALFILIVWLRSRWNHSKPNPA